MLQAKGTNGTLSFDGRTVMIDRKGPAARMLVGKGTKAIPLGSIVAVQWKPAGLVAGAISFTVAGGVERRSKFGRQAIDAMQDENSVAFHRHRQAQFEQLRDAIQAAVSGSYPEPAPSPPPASQGPPAGWYTDPHGQAGQRWWDGATWTEHTTEG